MREWIAAVIVLGSAVPPAATHASDLIEAMQTEAVSAPGSILIRVSPMPIVINSAILQPGEEVRAGENDAVMFCPSYAESGDTCVELNMDSVGYLGVLGSPPIVSGGLQSRASLQAGTASTSIASSIIAGAVAEDPDVTDPADDFEVMHRDRFEGLNRAVWGFNQTADRFVLKPASTVYRTITPKFVRRGVSKAFQNLTEPWSFVNNVLQGRPGRALDNLGRFAVNTTVGIGGLMDPATKWGIRPAQEDLGQTLAVWGIGSSAYLVLPIFGPSTIRDGFGTVVGFFADPVQICLNACGNLSSAVTLGITALRVTSRRAELTESGVDTFLKTSLDPYAAARSAFFQRRRIDIANYDRDDEGQRMRN
jgi:phospholipid-binding lipoprotein MlaA